ncbi:hypothetical protein D3C75_1071610 [compost metagenome]
MNPIDHLAFVVALLELQGQLQAAGRLLAQGMDVGEGFAAIDLGLAQAEHVQVGAVEHEQGGHG